MVEGEDGVFYGTTPRGGANGDGVFFRVAVTPAPLPTLTATVAVPVVNPVGGAGDGFMFTLSKPRAVKTIIRFRLKGSAVNGRDYAFLPGRAKIRPGDTIVSVPVVPMGDLGGAASRKLKFVIEPDPAFIVGTPGAVQIKIVRP